MNNDLRIRTLKAYLCQNNFVVHVWLFFYVKCWEVTGYCFTWEKKSLMKILLNEDNIELLWEPLRACLLGSFQPELKLQPC